MIELDLECSEPGVMKEQTEGEHVQRPHNFSILPSELQTHIFALAVSERESRLVALSIVCRPWRNIILDTPTFWRRFILSDRTTQEKADSWLQRARGCFDSLLICMGFDFETHPGIFRNASHDFWSSLHSLELQCAIRPCTFLPKSAYKEMRLQNIALKVTKPEPEFWSHLWTMDTSRMRNFQAKVALGEILLAGFACTTLKTLELSGRFARQDVITLLERNPMLETLLLSLQLPSGSDGSSISTRTVKLNSLRRLELYSCGDASFYLPRIIAPNIKALRLDFMDASCGEALISKRLAQLEDLYIAYCKFPASLVTKLLQNACSLKTLRIMKSEYDRSWHAVLEALATTIPNGGATRTLYCPQLQRISLYCLPELTTKLATQLVKSRLPGCTMQSDSDTGSFSSAEELSPRPLPIVRLELHDCRSISQDSLDWFKHYVPTFIYVKNTLYSR